MKGSSNDFILMLGTVRLIKFHREIKVKQNKLLHGTAQLFKKLSPTKKPNSKNKGFLSIEREGGESLSTNGIPSDIVRISISNPPSPDTSPVPSPHASPGLSRPRPGPSLGTRNPNPRKRTLPLPGGKDIEKKKSDSLIKRHSAPSLFEY